MADLPALLTELGVDDAAAQDVLGKVPADGAVTFGELQRLLSGEQQLPSEAPDPKVMEFLRILDEPVGGNLLLLEYCCRCRPTRRHVVAGCWAGPTAERRHIRATVQQY